MTRLEDESKNGVDSKPVYGPDTPEGQTLSLVDMIFQDPIMTNPDIRPEEKALYTARYVEAWIQRELNIPTDETPDTIQEITEITLIDNELAA